MSTLASNDSVWFKKYEQEAQGKRQAGNGNKKIVFIILPIMFLIFAGMALSNGGVSDPQTKSALAFMLGIFVFLLIFVLLLTGRAKKIDAAKTTRDNLNALLLTLEEVSNFDAQMSAAPLFEIVNDMGDSVFGTADYLGKKYKVNGDLTYRFIKMSDIRSMHYSKTKSMGANPMSASFFLDWRDGKGEILMNGSVDTGKKLDALTEAIRKIVPDLQIQQE